MKTFNGLIPEDFLKTIWQRKPAFFQGGFQTFPTPFSPDDFLRWAGHFSGLSRLVTMPGFVKGSRWNSQDGPFTKSVIKKLPETKWTLLVSETDRMSEGMDALKQLVSFLPAWRIDDVMVSWSPTGGSVGPHTDEYDVFLIQIGGRKRWRFTESPVKNPDLIKGVNLKILKNFQYDQEIICHPGDVIYLPPGIGHEGVALDEGYTISIGFRAPSIKESVPYLLEMILGSTVDSRFTDQGRLNQSPSFEFPDSDRNRFVEMLHPMYDSALFTQWMVSLATMPKRGFHYTGSKPSINNSTPLKWQPGVRRLYVKEAGNLVVSVEGEVFNFGTSQEETVVNFLESGLPAGSPASNATFGKLIKYCVKNRFLKPVGL